MEHKQNFSRLQEPSQAWLEELLGLLSNSAKESSLSQLDVSI